MLLILGHLQYEQCLHRFFLFLCVQTFDWLYNYINETVWRLSQYVLHKYTLQNSSSLVRLYDDCLQHDHHV